MEHCCKSLAREFIFNFTDKPITTYDYGGNIVTLEPNKKLQTPNGAVFIIEKESYARFVGMGISSERLFITACYGIGRDNIEVCQIRSWDNKIRLLPEGEVQG